MRRAAISMVALVMLLSCAAPASAAPPVLGAVSATNIQGVSALLKGTVDPQGLPASYWFEYGTAANFAGAAKTAAGSAGSGSGAEPARATLAGLQPSTTYFYRLVANSTGGTTSGSTGAGTAGSFTTTQGFDFKPGTDGFAVAARADGGDAATLAGSHPYQLDFSLRFNQGGEFEGQPGVAFPDGDLRDLRIDLPAGLIFNPNALDKCSAVDFHVPRASPFEQSLSGESCPDKSQVGTIELNTSIGGGQTRRFGIFNLDPAPGVTAQLGAAPFGEPIVFDLLLRSGPDGSYALSIEVADFPQALDVSGMSLALWGVPWGASHDGERGSCLNESEPSFPWCKSSAGEPSASPPQAYLTMPGTCSPALSFTASASAWQQPTQVFAAAANLDSGGLPAPVSQCAAIPFAPVSQGLLTTTKASTSSGYNFQLTNDNVGLLAPASRAPSPTGRAVVTLPAGTTINPSVGAGLGVCAPNEYAAETVFNGEGAGCPNASKIGDFSVRSPLFDGLFGGAIYLAKPFDNPFASLIAVYLVAKLPERGMMIKVAGKIAPDPRDGSITAIFDGLPQLPYSDLNLTFRSGQRAFLISPARCGAANTQVQMSPWSGGDPVTSANATQITSGIDAGPCPPPGAPPFAPDAITGGVNSNVGSYTPYYVHLIRRDTEQEITSYSLVLPEGITGKLAGIPFCPNAAIEAARRRSGVEEANSPSCPAASQVGRTLIGYGVGAALTYATGRIYLAGPYHGAPLSLVTVNSATVGPFDLGTIVVRSAFQVDPYTAQLRIDSRASDPIPHIIDGVPLHLRDVRVYVDRYRFTHNPSSCEASQLVSTLTGSGASFATPADDSTAVVTKHFQLLNCLTLGFRPKLGIRLRGGSRRGAYPSLRATFASRGPQDSNLKRIEVVMPHSEFLAQNHIRDVCTRRQFDVGNCPGGSVYGRAVAYTPLFDEPLRGNVYLRSSSNRLPDLVADLYSGAVRIIIEGKIGPSKSGGIRAFFDNLPDEPLDRFTMTLAGGKRGLLTNSANICHSPPLASVKGLAQNNRGAIFTTVLRGQCKKDVRHRGHRGQRRAKR
jgi:hypothetical protein